MGMTVKQLESILLLEKRAIQAGSVTLTRRQAELWCISHINDDWYELPLMLMARGYGGDHFHFTEVNPDSVYEPSDHGCFIALPDGWSKFQLWLRDSALCHCSHPWTSHEPSLQTACIGSNEICSCCKFRLCSRRERPTLAPPFKVGEPV